MNETTEEIKKTWKDFVPRKIAGGLVAMYLIAQAASELKEASLYQFVVTIGCMTILGFAAIWTHYLLERGPKPDKELTRVSSLVARGEKEHGT